MRRFVIAIRVEQGIVEYPTKSRNIKELRKVAKIAADQINGSIETIYELIPISI